MAFEIRSLETSTISLEPLFQCPSSIRQLAQLGVEQLIDRCGIDCEPVRDLLVDYLRERQAGIDHVTLVRQR